MKLLWCVCFCQVARQILNQFPTWESKDHTAQQSQQAPGTHDICAVVKNDFPFLKPGRKTKKACVQGRKSNGFLDIKEINVFKQMPPDSVFKSKAEASEISDIEYQSTETLATPKTFVFERQFQQWGHLLCFELAATAESSLTVITFADETALFTSI